jgi:hypothetical protein
LNDRAAGSGALPLSVVCDMLILLCVSVGMEAAAGPRRAVGDVLEGGENGGKAPFSAASPAGGGLSGSSFTGSVSTAKAALTAPAHSGRGAALTR